MSDVSMHGDWSKEDLIAHIARLENRKQHGLVWEEDQAEGESDAGYHPQAVLSEVSQNSVGGDSSLSHILIEGDNLHALSALSGTHQKAVDLIYIDPPYNRGMRDGNDSRYNDQYVNRNDASRHSRWLSFMNKRLVIAKQLLKDDGVIFVSIDDNELAHLKILMDEIFGEENYKNTIIIKRGAKNVQAQFESIDKLYSGYEYVLF
ncbi:MAG: site-specific DNA-methyltransferase [Anaerolineales bacterium]|uniref:site-specific DNA-methyltransferase n=1 Tax=Candidatus Villigracilis proximus TaxID=3140683 RepID=UPI003135DBA3|nr:site-specific DNA-methyltransferase [Anaerolineales bacterium]